MSTARPPEGARTAAAGEGTPVSFDVLAEEGITDFEADRNDPASALLADIFVNPDAPLPAGASHTASA